MLKMREQRGIELFRQGAVRKNDESRYTVMSAKQDESYDVCWERSKWVCCCPDYRKGKKCKHIYAVLYYQMHERLLSELLQDEVVRCPYCGQSDRIVKRGFRYNRRGITQRYGCQKCGRRFIFEPIQNYKHRASVIMKALDLYFRGLSLRQVAEHLTEFSGINVSYTTIMRWIRTFSEIASNYINTTAPKTKGERWASDETVIRLSGRQILLWSLLDEQTRYLVALQISTKRSGHEAERIFREGLERSEPPLEIITDGASCYKEAVDKIFGNRRVVHIAGPTFKTGVNNNKMERLNGTLKGRLRQTPTFRSEASARAFCQGFRVFYNYMKPHRSLRGKTPAELMGLTDRKLGWKQILDLARK